MRLLSITFAVGALGLATAASSQTGSAVTIKNFRFSPTPVTVPAGSEVVWKNIDGEIHTVVSVDGAFRSSALDEGDTFAFTFMKPGTYAYICSVHPQMKGRIVVK